MATIQGNGGTVTVGGFVGKFDTWSGNILYEDVDTTGFGNTWATCAPVGLSLNGSATGTLEYGAAGCAPFATSAAGATAAVVLQANGTNQKFAFNAVISRVSVERPHAGKASLSLDFESTGTITETWS